MLFLRSMRIHVVNIGSHDLSLGVQVCSHVVGSSRHCRCHHHHLKRVRMCVREEGREGGREGGILIEDGW